MITKFENYNIENLISKYAIIKRYNKKSPYKLYIIIFNNKLSSRTNKEILIKSIYPIDYSTFQIFKRDTGFVDELNYNIDIVKTYDTYEEAKEEYDNNIIKDTIDYGI